MKRLSIKKSSSNFAPSKFQFMDQLLNTAIEAGIEGGKLIMEIYDKDFEISSKEDRSPLTEADMASNDVINSYLANTGIPIISEENKQIDFTERKDWDHCWIVDPLDGTKEFIKKNGEFTVNIALCIGGSPIFGVIYVPVSRELYFADVSKKVAFKTLLDQDHNIKNGLWNENDRINPSTLTNKKLRVVGSRSHMNQDTLDFIKSVEESYEDIEIVSKGSSLKFCLVAEGKADIYPRFAPTMEWDTAAGQAICEAVGLKVISQHTQRELRYNKENLLNPYFVVRHP